MRVQASAALGRVVAFPMIAIEAMVGRVDVHVDVPVGGGDLADASDRDMLVLLAEVEHGRDLRLQVLHAYDAAAVIADRGAQARKPARRDQATVPPKQ